MYPFVNLLPYLFLHVQRLLKLLQSHATLYFCPEDLAFLTWFIEKDTSNKMTISYKSSIAKSKISRIQVSVYKSG